MSHLDHDLDQLSLETLATVRGGERTLAERAVIERAIAGLAARVYITDGNALFNRSGPRLVESLEIMAACLPPGSFADFDRAHAAAIVRIA
jgi:iron complex transport system substrate-binding protein